MDLRRRYKQKSFGFGNLRESRFIRADQQEKSRKEQRTRNFTKNRNLDDAAATPTQDSDSKSNVSGHDRMHRLLKWKAERDKRKKMEQAYKKPVFKVSVVHHKFYSPVNKPKAAGKICKQPEKEIVPIRKLTRATQKRLLAKQEVPKFKTVTTRSPVHTKVEKAAIVSLEEPTDAEVKQRESFAPANYEFKAPGNLLPVPMFGRVPILNTPNVYVKSDIFGKCMQKQSDKPVKGKSPSLKPQNAVNLDMQVKRNDLTLYTKKKTKPKVRVGQAESDFFHYASTNTCLKRSYLKRSRIFGQDEEKESVAQSNPTSLKKSMKNEEPISAIMRVLRTRTIKSITPEIDTKIANKHDEEIGTRKENNIPNKGGRKSLRKTVVRSKKDKQFPKNMDVAAVTLTNGIRAGKRWSRKTVKYNVSRRSKRIIP